MRNKHGSQLNKVAVGWILNFYDAPRVLSTPYLLAVDFNHGIGTNNGKGDGLSKLLYLLLVFLILVTENRSTGLRVS